MAKVFERILYDQLYAYQEEHDIICKHQSGFRAIHSTVTALFEATDTWAYNIDRRKSNAVIFQDLKKASTQLTTRSSCRVWHIWKRPQMVSVIFRELHSNVLHQWVALEKFFIKLWRTPGDDSRVSIIYQRSFKLSMKL